MLRAPWSPMPEIDFEVPDLQRFNDALERFARRGIPFVARNTLNGAAFRGREIWTKVVLPAKLEMRNKWTVRSIRVVKARGRSIRRMESRLGSLADYMAIQERGGTERKKGTHGVPIPTSVASGEGRGKQPRKKLVRRPNRLPNIRLTSLRPGMSAEQRRVVAVAMAARTKRRYVFMDLGERKGIYRVRGGKRPKVDLIWDLTKGSVVIPPSGTLAKTLLLLTPQIPDIAKRAMIQQLRFNRVTGF